MKTIIKNARLAQGLSARELAQMIGVDQTLISRFEKGDRFPTKEQLHSLAGALNLSSEELMKHWIKERILKEYGSEIQVKEALALVNEELITYKRGFPILSKDLAVLLKEIDNLKLKLDDLRSFDSYRISQALELEYTFESNRIEGNTLTLQETDLVINEGLTVAGKSMREHLEAINHNEAIAYVKDLVHRKVKINERELLSIHNLILRGIMPEYAGKYRKVQVMIKGSQHMPPQPFLVAKKMEEYFEWFAENKDKLHPVVLAAAMHERLVTIHPFIDGNGRTSRLIMNLLLLQKGFVIANIKGDYSNRMNYYTALEAVQVQDDKEAFLMYVATVEKECLERYLQILT
ncbi:MAG: Fic family protein [Bacteroidota bacterium]